jgi:hypothetical protein
VGKEDGNLAVAELDPTVDLQRVADFRILSPNSIGKGNLHEEREI